MLFRIHLPLSLDLPFRTGQPWTGPRVASLVCYGAAIFVWSILGNRFLWESVVALRTRNYTWASFLCALQLCCIAVAIFVCIIVVKAALKAESWRGIDTRDMQFLYLYIIFVANMALFRHTNPTASQTYFPIYLFHCNVGTLYALRLSRMLLGWALISPVYLYWDLQQWWNDPAGPALQFHGRALEDAAIDRGARLVLGGLASIVFVQLVYGPALHCNFCGLNTPSGPQAAATPSVSATDQEREKLHQRAEADAAPSDPVQATFLPPGTAVPSSATPLTRRRASQTGGATLGSSAGSSTDLASSPPFSARRLSDPSGSSAPCEVKAASDRCGPVWRTLLSIEASCTAFDRRFYAFAVRMPHGVPTGVLALCGCLPYSVYLLGCSIYRIVMHGDEEEEVKFRPSEMALALLSACLLGRTDIQGFLRRLSRAEEVLHDLVPKHVANVLLAAAVAAGRKSRIAPARTQQSSNSSSKRTSVAGGAPGISERSGPRGNSGGSQGAGAMISAAVSGDLATLQPSQGPLTDPLDRCPGEDWISTSEYRDDQAAGRACGRLRVSSQGQLGVDTEMGNLAQPQEPDSYASPALIAEWHEGVSVLFADIRGFTEMAQQVEPFEVMAFLNRLYQRFDSLACSMPGIYKVETIGDCYMVASGLLEPDPDHAASLLRFASSMLAAAREVLLPHTLQPVQLRVGVHSGRVMSGVVGSIRKRFCLFGDTVNTASRLETTSLPGRIHISADTHRLASSSPAAAAEFAFEVREPIHVKGKGVMQTYFANPLAKQQATGLHAALSDQEEIESETDNDAIGRS